MSTIFEQLAHGNKRLPIEEREIILGYIRGQCDYAPLCSYLIGGQTQQGKSVILAYLCYMVVLAGSQLVIIDPHCNKRRCYLTQKVEQLADWFIGDQLDFTDMDEVLARFEWLAQEYKRRKAPGGMEGKQPLYLIVEEFNELLSELDKAQRNRVTGIIGNLARGGSKHGLFCVLCAHNWELQRTGGSDVRRNVRGRIRVQCESSEMAMILNVGKRELDRFTRPPLKPGDAIVKRPCYGLVRIQYPLTEREDCAAIATIMHRISEYSCEKSAKLALLPASEGEQTATALAVRDEGDNSFRKDIQTGLNVSTSGSDRALPALYEDLKHGKPLSVKGIDNFRRADASVRPTSRRPLAGTRTATSVKSCRSARR
jgi:hypothetical protein